jgi:hypothetical protein
MGKFFDYITPPTAPIPASNHDKALRVRSEWVAKKRDWNRVGFWWGLIGLRNWAGVTEGIKTCDDHIAYIDKWTTATQKETK